MVNRNAKNGYKIVKKDHINVACELSLNNVKIAGSLEIGAFPFSLSIKCLYFLQSLQLHTMASWQASLLF